MESNPLCENSLPSEAGAQLVSILDQEEQDAVQELCGTQMCWLGLKEPSDSESWRWLDGSPLSFESWQQGEPNNFGGLDENRAIMNLNIQQARSNRIGF